MYHIQISQLLLSPGGLRSGRRALVLNLHGNPILKSCLNLAKLFDVRIEELFKYEEE